MNLSKYQPTEKFKKLLPQGEDKIGKFFEINGTDGYFKMKARLVCDYHVDELLKRSDKKAEGYFVLKSKSTTSTSTPTQKK